MEIYELTLPIVGAENFIMGITLLVLSVSKAQGMVHNKLGLRFFAASMLNLSLINFVEIALGRSEGQSLAIVVFAASVELLLLMFAYISMLDRYFVTVKRILVEIVFVFVFTLPAVFVSPEHNPLLFTLLFTVSIAYYIVKLTYNLHIYKKHIMRVAKAIESYSSDGSAALLQWINNTFYLVLAVGVISIVIPLTNYTVLTFYNIFIFFAYLYLYIEIMRNFHVFEYNISAMQLSEYSKSSEEMLMQKFDGSEVVYDLRQVTISDNGFMNLKQDAFDRWLSRRVYAIPGITADEIASQLGTNRTKLSLALKNELQMNFYEWIAYLRVEDAKRQLKEFPDRPVCEIAVIVGIEDKSNFGRLFKRIVGISPATYRCENQSGINMDA